MQIILRFTLLAACAAVPGVGEGHGGGLDSYGCHHNRKAGGYHCHRGQLAGQDFVSKTEMLDVLAAPALASESDAAELAGHVVAIADGDTLTVLVSRKQIKVRLTEIDAPERRQPFGTRSRQSLAALCHGKPARIDEQSKDRYGRTLGHVSCARVHGNAEQVGRGMARVYVRYAPKDSPLYAVQAEARAAERGLWGDPRPVAPWEWRREKR